MQRPCIKDHDFFSPQTCPVCALAVSRPHLAQLWGIEVDSRHVIGAKIGIKLVQEIIDEHAAMLQNPPKPPKPQCAELGRPLRPDEYAKFGIDPDKCNCRNKLRLCAVHEICTTGSKREGVACCEDCPDFTV